MQRRKLAILIVLAVLAAASLGFYWWKTTTSQKQIEEHVAAAEQFERVRNYEKALKELEEALRYVAVNDEATRDELEQKIDELKQKVEQTKRISGSSESESTSSAQGGSAAEDDNQSSNGGGADKQPESPQEPETVDVAMLGTLLPTSFSGLEGNLADGEEIASVRFDDLASDSTYLIYVYRQSDPEAADRLVKSVTENVYNINVREVSLRGDFEGFTGLFALNEQGDAGIFFAYGPLNFECLVRTTTLSDEQKFNKLLELQSLIKKP